MAEVSRCRPCHITGNVPCEEVVHSSDLASFPTHRRHWGLIHAYEFVADQLAFQSPLPVCCSSYDATTNSNYDLALVMIVKTCPNPSLREEATRVGKKKKERKKERKNQDTTACSVQDPWLCEAGDATYGCMVEKETEEQAALGPKGEQGSSREHSRKVKRKIHQEEDILPGHSELSRSMESNCRKGKKKKPVRTEVLEYIPLGDHPKATVKKETKAKKKEEKPVPAKPALKKRKKKKKKESTVTVDSWKEEPDRDLVVVMEKKGNMDQVRQKALQEQIDRESGKTGASEPRKWTGTQLGQGDTADFENKKQKLKFLKLMGGFKNLSPLVSRSPHVTARPNVVLSKAADSLQQQLQQL
ncbi:lysine-rich nucleolar protein 1-like [Octodon degus]|uniref:Lysine-rich nucleolar protein 1-like n=1 Tax=Octodon degus TaxID=10160 RepID=A0A6P6EK44_OCTDE|nr:lysine-rich nucleolar protein 1-like [Octodon degus]